MWVSWKHDTADLKNPLSFEQKIEIFYEQTLGWQLHIADLIANGGTPFAQPNAQQPEPDIPSIPHSGFAVLHICFSYFELIGSLYAPQLKHDREKFEHGIKLVLPEAFKETIDEDNMLKLLYHGGRCGLYHAARTRSGVGLGQPADGTSIAYDATHKSVIVNPHQLPRNLKTHLEKFKIELLNPAHTALRAEFEKQFDKGFE